MTAKRKTIYFTGKEQLEVREEPIPAAGPGEILVKTTRTLVSTGTESIVFTRNFAPGTHWDRWASADAYPFPTGYSHVGRVATVGEGITDFKIGDRVASTGNHTSHLIVSPPHVVKIPEGVSDEDATWMTLSRVTQSGVRLAEHQLGDDVVIIGLGLLGQLTLQYVRLSGAREIICIDTAPMRLKMAAAHGATRMLQISAADALPQVQEYTAGRRADVVYDITGHPAVLSSALPLARNLGAVVLVGDPGDPSQQRLTPDVIKRGVRIIGANSALFPHEHSDLARWSGQEMYELFLTYVQRGQMSFADLITHRFKPDQAAECYAMLQRERATAMGVLFEWD